MSTPPSNIPVSVNYTSRDFYSLREELIARVQSRIPEWTANDPSDFGVALVEAFAYLGDMVSYYIDRMANESVISTATQRKSLLALASMYGYYPAGYRQASVFVEFQNSSDYDILIPAGTILSGDVKYGDTVQTVYFTLQNDATVPAAVGDVAGTTTELCTEGRSVTAVSTNTNAYGELIGTSNGAPSMEFELAEFPVVQGSIAVYVQAGDVYTKWTEVQHLIDYGPLDLVYETYLDSANNVFVRFGDGVSGAIPNAYSEIRALYTVGGGNIGNVVAGTLTDIVSIPGLSESQVVALKSTITIVTNDIAVGGAEPESDEEIRINAPKTLRALNRAVTLQDYESLALSVSGIGKASADASVWTDVQVYIAPSRTALETDPTPGYDPVSTTSTTSLTIASSGSISLTVGTGLSLTAGQSVVIRHNAANMIFGTITGYTSGSGALVVTATGSLGSGTYTSWTVQTLTQEYLTMKADLDTYLADKILIGATATVCPPVYVDAVCEIEFTPLDQYLPSEVKVSITNSLLTAFGYVNESFGSTIYPQNIEFVLQQVPGVKSAKVTALYRDGIAGLTTLVGAKNEIFRFADANLTVTEV